MKQEAPGPAQPSSRDSQLLKRLKHSRLLSLDLDPLKERLALIFRVEEGPLLRLEMRHVVQFNYSNATYEPPPETPASYFVGDVVLVPIEDGGQKVLTYLNHQFIHQDDFSRVQYYPSVRLFYLHLEGEIMLDAVAISYQLEEMASAPQP